MNNIVDLKITRTAIAEVCGACEYPDFSIVDDKTEGLIVICDNCGAIMGSLLVNDENGAK